MVGVRTSWRRSLLLAASVLLTVAVAVASNQVLNDGMWSWWWSIIAVALTTAGALVTYALTRTAKTDVKADAEQGGHSQPSPIKDRPLSAAPPQVQLPPAAGAQTQLNLPSAGGIVNAIQGGTMNIHPLVTPVPPPDEGGRPS